MGRIGQSGRALAIALARTGLHWHWHGSNSTYCVCEVVLSASREDANRRVHVTHCEELHGRGLMEVEVISRR